jgi:hypothetical protein
MGLSSIEEAEPLEKLMAAIVSYGHGKEHSDHCRRYKIDGLSSS